MIDGDPEFLGRRAWSPRNAGQSFTKSDWPHEKAEEDEGEEGDNNPGGGEMFGHGNSY